VPFILFSYTLGDYEQLRIKESRAAGDQDVLKLLWEVSMRRLGKYYYTSSVTLLLASVLGCGSGQSSTAVVEGKVTANGKPLDKVLVEFWPEGEGRRSLGETDSQGSYKLMTDDGKNTGAVIGTHKIVLKDSAALGEKFLGREGETEDLSKGRKSRIPPKYSSAETTPLSKRVEEGKVNQLDLEVSN
jgi:hypothetical protein